MPYTNFITVSNKIEDTKEKERLINIAKKCSFQKTIQKIKVMITEINNYPITIERQNLHPQMRMQVLLTGDF